MSAIGEGGGNVPPELKTFYKEKIEHSVTLFEKSLEKYQDSGLAAQKDQYKKVMERALIVMNEAAKAGLNATVKEQAAQLKQDYENIIGDRYSSEQIPEEEINKLNKDLEQLNKSLKR